MCQTIPILKRKLQLSCFADSDSEEYTGKFNQRNHKTWAKFIGQETVTNIAEEEFTCTKGLSTVRLEDSGIQTGEFLHMGLQNEL